MPPRMILTDHQIMLVRSDYAAGLSQSAIGVKHDIDKAVVRRYVQDMPGRRASDRKVIGTIVTCAGCGAEFENPKGGRVYCTKDCYTDLLRRQKEDRLAEFEWIACTDTWENIALRLGYTGTKQLREWLRKSGQEAWADRINEDVYRPRQGRWAA